MLVEEGAPQHGGNEANGPRRQPKSVSKLHAGARQDPTADASGLESKVARRRQPIDDAEQPPLLAAAATGAPIA